MQLNNARILLTGATGGLGQERARQLAEAGAKLLMAGRDTARLATLTTTLAVVIPASAPTSPALRAALPQQEPRVSLELTF